MKISSIKPLRFQKQFVSVHLEEGEPFRLHEEIVEKYRLKPGMDLSEAQLEEIRRTGEQKEAREYAFLFLSYRDRSEKEMRERLRKRNFSRSAIDAVMTDLRGQKLLNDETLARGLSESRLKNRLWGDQRIREDMVRKGIDPKLAEKTLKEVQSEIQSEIPSEDDRAYELLLKRQEQMRSLDAHTVYRRLFGYLARRGFSPDIVQKALDRFRREGHLKAHKEHQDESTNEQE